MLLYLFTLLDFKALGRIYPDVQVKLQKVKTIKPPIKIGSRKKGLGRIEPTPFSHNATRTAQELDRYQPRAFIISAC